MTKKTPYTAKRNDILRTIGLPLALREEATLRDGRLAIVDAAHVAMATSTDPLWSGFPDCDLDLKPLQQALKTFPARTKVSIYAPTKKEVQEALKSRDGKKPQRVTARGRGTSAYYWANRHNAPVAIEADGVRLVLHIAAPPDGKGPKVPTLSSQASHEVRVATFQDAVKKATQVCDHIAFLSDGRSLTCSIESGLGSIAATLSDSLDERRDLVRGLYSLDYLQAFAKVLPAGDLTFSFAHDYPMRMAWKTDRGEEAVILAPRIERE